MADKLTYHTDRSRIIDYRRCHRKRFFSHEIELVESAGVRGISPTAVNLPMTIGNAVHEGLECVHIWHSINSPHKEKPTDLLDFAVKVALDYFNGAVLREELSLQDSQAEIAQDEFAFLDAPAGAENVGKKREFKIREGRALAEALVRSYHTCGLPLLLDRYEILMVEKEMSSLLVEQSDLNVQLNGRTDAIMREKLTGNLAVLSIKTATKLDYRAEKNWQEDDQGISECYLVREMVRAGLLEEFGYSPFDNVQVGVQMLQLLKGYEKCDDYDGIWKHVNPVVWPYTQEQPSGELTLRPEYYYMGEDGKKHALGKYWKAKHIWETDVEMQDWISDMVLNYPGVLEKSVLFPQLLLRSNEEMDDWAREAALQEMNLATLRMDIDKVGQGVFDPENKEGSYINWQMVLASEFPKNRASCNYPGPCEFKSLCHPVAGELGMSTIGEMLVEQGLVQVSGFRQRKANHVVEEEK